VGLLNLPLVADETDYRLASDVTSTLTYNASAPTNLGFVDAYHDVPDITLVPLEVVPLVPATKTIELEVSFATMDDGTNRGMFNQITYNRPLVPSIFSEISLGPNATVNGAYGPLSFVVDHLDIVEIVVKNGDTGKHPLCVFFSHLIFDTFLTAFILATCTVTSSQLLDGRKIIPLMIRHSIRPLWKDSRIPCVATLFKSQR
jgi:hypothetical protein